MSGEADFASMPFALRKLVQFHAFGIYCTQTVLRGVQAYLAKSAQALYHVM